MSDPDHPLIGAWQLRAWVAISDDGSEAKPMGDAPEGLLVYSADATMIGLMAAADRPAFATNDLTGGTLDEQAMAFGSFIAYGGPYEIDGDTVIHHVSMSLFPNWVSTEQRRRWEVSPDGTVLILTSPPITFAGGTRTQRLTWERRLG